MATGKVTMKIDAESAKAVEGFLELENKQEALKQKAKETADTSQTGAKSSARANSEWGRSLRNIVTGYFGISAAVGAAKTALREMHEEREKGARSEERRAKGFGQLAQLAGSAEELRQMEGEAERSMLETGMTFEEAGSLQFALESAEAPQQRAFFARLRGVAQPTQMLEGAVTLRGAMGQAEIGNLQAVSEKMFAASAGTKTTAQDLAIAAAKAGQSAGAIGATDEETLAALQILSRATKSPEMAGTQLRSLAKSIRKQDRVSKDQGVLQAVREIEAMDLSADQKGELLGGREEGFTAYRTIVANLPEITQMSGKLAEAERRVLETGEATATRERVGAFLGVHGRQRELEKERSKLKLKRREMFGDVQLQREIAELKQETGSLAAGESGLIRTGRRFGAGTAEYLGASPGLVARAGQLGAQLPVLSHSLVAAVASPVSGGVMAAGRQAVEAITQDPGTPVTVSGNIRGAKVDVNITDERSPQGNRMGGANGVE